jgi:hypothetical protein
MHIFRKPRQWRWPWCYGLLSFLCGLFLGVTARAECPCKGGVQQSGMDQGQAKIAVQSNLRISIKGERATSAERVDAVGKAVQAKTAQLKACYESQFKSDPTAVGAVEVLLSFTETSSRPELDIRPNAGFTKDMLSCLRRLLASATLPQNERPASALATLAFSNSRAQGEQAMQDRKSQSADTEPVAVNAAGKLEGVWSSPDHKITFTTNADKAEPKQSVAAAQQALRKSLGAFLDCRRKAAKGGADPSAQTAVAVSWYGSRTEAAIESTTLTKDQAVTCMKKIFKRLKIENGPEQGRLSVTVSFGP